jgi:hypothetical protein
MEDSFYPLHTKLLPEALLEHHNHTHNNDDSHKDPHKEKESSHVHYSVGRDYPQVLKSWGESIALVPLILWLYKPRIDLWEEVEASYRLQPFEKAHDVCWEWNLEEGQEHDYLEGHEALTQSQLVPRCDEVKDKESQNCENEDLGYDVEDLVHLDGQVV